MILLQASVALGENLVLFLLMIFIVVLPVLTLLIARRLAKRHAERNTGNEEPQAPKLKANLGVFFSGCLLSMLLIAVVLIVGYLLLSAVLPDFG